MGQVFLLSLAAALNPVLVGASTVMLLLPNPARLMLGYLLGALMTSVTLGLVIVFGLKGSSAVSTTENTLNPAVDVALGAIMLVAAFVLGTGRDKRIAERGQARKDRKEDKGPPRWQQALSKGSPRTTFLVGALLTLPGASYLAGLNQIEKQNLSTTATVAVVIGFNLIMLMLLELPLLGYAIAPDWTPGAVDRSKAYVSRNGHKAAVIAAHCARRRARPQRHDRARELTPDSAQKESAAYMTRRTASNRGLWTRSAAGTILSSARRKTLPQTFPRSQGRLAHSQSAPCSALRCVPQVPNVTNAAAGFRKQQITPLDAAGLERRMHNSSRADWLFRSLRRERQRGRVRWGMGPYEHFAADPRQNECRARPRNHRSRPSSSPKRRSHARMRFVAIGIVGSSAD